MNYRKFRLLHTYVASGRQNKMTDDLETRQNTRNYKCNSSTMHYASCSVREKSFVCDLWFP